MKRTTITAVVAAAIALCGLAVAVESRNVSSRAAWPTPQLPTPAIWYPTTHEVGPSTPLTWTTYPHVNPLHRHGAWHFAPGRVVGLPSRNGK
jgi:hypothetical protein